MYISSTYQHAVQLSESFILIYSFQIFVAPLIPVKNFTQITTLKLHNGVKQIMYIFAGYHSKKILQDSNHAHLKIIFTFLIIYSAFKLVLHMHSMMLILNVGMAIIYYYGEQLKAPDIVRQNPKFNRDNIFPLFFSDTKQNYFYSNT